MREHIATVQKGNDVRAEFVGKTVTWQKAQTMDEALTNGHFTNEAALVAAAEAQRDIAIRAEIRKILGKPDGTIEAAQAKATSVKVGEAKQREPGAVTQPKTAKGKVDRTAKDIGATLFERAIANPDWGKQASSSARSRKRSSTPTSRRRPRSRPRRRLRPRQRRLTSG